MKIKRFSGVILLTILFLLMSAVPVNADQDDGDQNQEHRGTPSYIGGSGITIDGYYDDWEGIPKTSISWGDNNGKYFHEGAMIRDGEYIYVYLETHKKYSSQIPLSDMVFSVDRHDAVAFIHFVNQVGTGPDWARSGELYDLSKGIHLGMAPFTSYPSYPRGVAAVTIDKNNNPGGDKLEFAISIRELARMTHVPASTSGIPLFMLSAARADHKECI
jgi:hypothetical protein